MLQNIKLERFNMKCQKCELNSTLIVICSIQLMLMCWVKM
jgi:hypothetical protein